VLTTGPARTLFYILQSTHTPEKSFRDQRKPSWNHPRLLEEIGFITREDEGRTQIVRTMEKCVDYSGLSRHPRAMKQQLKKKLA
jgi:hypothetical protein